jgi:BCD family chlorophyll transporter-like MFS transporter
MHRVTGIAVRGISRVSARYLPFADAATTALPLSRIARLGLFQVSVGMAMTLLAGTLNRVMIVELGVPSSLVAVVLGLPLLFAPLRALIGFRSDVHVSVLGWRRVPFIWFGTLMQFGGLAIMPFALILLSGDSNAPHAVGLFATAFAFLLVGIGLHTTQTAGLALATDLATEENRPRVVALLYLMLLVGMVASSLLLGRLLQDFSQIRLIQVIQGAAVLTMVLNVFALWKQEPRAPRAAPSAAGAAAPAAARPTFRAAWRRFTAGGRAVRLLVAVAVGSVAFSMQDVLLEPYGGQIMRMGVGATTALTALMAVGSIVAFAISARSLGAGGDPLRLAAAGIVVGVLGFSLVIFAAPLASPTLFRFGTLLIGLGDGLFSVGTLTAAMGLRDNPQHGIALGAWGAVVATSDGLALAASGLLRDGISQLAERGVLGTALQGEAVPYSVVYHLEIALLFAALVALGPLVTPLGAHQRRRAPARFGLADLPT